MGRLHPAALAGKGVVQFEHRVRAASPTDRHACTAGAAFGPQTDRVTALRQIGDGNGGAAVFVDGQPAGAAVGICRDSGVG